MDVLYPRCAAMEVHKKSLRICRRLREADGSEQVERRAFSTMTPDLLSMMDWLLEGGVTHVAMESTGEYWKPIYNLLEGQLAGGSSTPTMSRTLPAERPMTKTRRGSLSCCSLVLGTPASSRPHPSGTCERSCAIKRISCESG
jgi:hypothetical protein